MKKMMMLPVILFFVAGVTHANGFNPFEMQKQQAPRMTLEAILEFIEEAATQRTDAASLRTFKQKMVRYSDLIARSVADIKEVDKETVDAILVHAESFALADKALVESEQVFTNEDKAFIHRLLINLVGKLESVVKIEEIEPLLVYTCAEVIKGLVQDCDANYVAVDNLYAYAVGKKIDPYTLSAAELDRIARQAVSYALRQRSMMAAFLHSDNHQRKVVDQSYRRPAVLQTVTRKSDRVDSQEEAEKLTLMEEIFNLDNALAEE